MTNLNISPVDKDLKIVKGTTKAYEVEISKDNVIEDITGWTVTFIAKEKMNDPDSSAVINIEASLSDATSGKALIRLEITYTDLPPGHYFYAIKFTDDESLPNSGIIVRGRLTIENSVL